MTTLSTGEPATLGNYRRLARLYFGEDSEAVKFLDKKIEEQGNDELVLADETQMVNLLFTIHYGGTDGTSEGDATGATI